MATVDYVGSGGASGERAGSVTAVQLPDIPARLIYIKAVASNAGNVYIGFVSVTKVDGTTDTTTGWELDAGEEMGPLPLNNLDLLYMICDNAGDDIVYLCIE